ncbi:hypothetical protein OE88DRAFT_1638905 [Heliocybe sulcata]|uniref:Methyltransferase domain-containing protein n=1 Tax=Heliocybe sulcata TaxID=5364 RepID=A0A5C3ML06_9AGAM|nr:hypothetical protein OE88DRAFT_1638905 [Heliocybe sulcata]
MTDLSDAPKPWLLPLDDRYYYLDEEEAYFFKTETGITDEDELKRHIISVQKKAFEVHQYPCIRIFEFARLKMARLPAYPHLLELGRERQDAIFLDLGCCFGNDVRKAVQDGFPVKNCVASDLENGLWELGHEMFCSTPESFPVPFVQGDILDPEFLRPWPSLPSKNFAGTETIPRDLQSLNPLRGRVSAVFTGAFFHLFSEQTQAKVAAALACLISDEPGSMLFGVQGGAAEKGIWQPTGSAYTMFCHSPGSWRELWTGIFGEDKVDVQARLRKEIGGDDFFGMFPGNKNPYHVLEWSVIRL